MPETTLRGRWGNLSCCCEGPDEGVLSPEQDAARGSEQLQERWQRSHASNTDTWRRNPFPQQVPKVLEDLRSTPTAAGTPGGTGAELLQKVTLEVGGDTWRPVVNLLQEYEGKANLTYKRFHIYYIEHDNKSTL